MDRWDDDEAFRVARELHGGPVVSASHYNHTTANCGLSDAPMAALDALIETAWSFPGFRCSYGAFEGSRAIRFHTSAGPESQAAIDCVRVDLSDAPRFIEALRSDECPVAFEDVRADSRTRPISAAFDELGCRSMVILPLLRGRRPVGLVMMDSDTPRTWGAKETAALDRLAPLMALTLEHVEAKAELASTRASGSRHERRITAIRGVTAGVAMDAGRILNAIRRTVDTDRQATRSLLDQLERIVDELDRVQRGPSRLTEPFDLARALREFTPGLNALTDARVRLDEQHDGTVAVEGNVTGIERLLVNLIAHVTKGATDGQALTLELSHRGNGDRAQLRIHGEGLDVDAALRRMGGGDPLITSEQVCPALWQARCEALVQDVRLTVEDDAVVLGFLAAEVDIDAAKSVG